MGEEIRIVIRKGDVSWVAQALEYDIAAQGKNPHEAMQAFMRTLACEIGHNSAQGKQPFEGIPRAPERFFEMWRVAFARPVEDPPRLSDFVRTPSWMINKIKSEPRIYV